MEEQYNLRLMFRRIVFMLSVCVSIVLYKYDFSDYSIVLALIVLFGGVFTISYVDVTYQHIRFRKSYFWGLIAINKLIEYSQVDSIRSKDYAIDSHPDAFLYTEGLFQFLTVDLNTPEVRWTTTKLTYKEKGKVKSIELKMTKDEFRDILWRVDRRTKYG